MRKLLTLLLILLVANPVGAQISIPNTFSPNTTISSALVNANFSTLGSDALNRTGGTLTGNVTSSAGVTITATTFIGNLTGNVTGNVSGTAPAGTLTGTTLASNVVTSSLTSLGTLGVLAVTGVASLSNDIQWSNNSGFGLKGQDGVRFLSYTTAGGAVIGAGANPTSVTSFGNNTVNGGANGTNSWGVLNTSAGGSSLARLYVQNNNAYTGALKIFAGNYSGTGTYDLANEVALVADVSAVGLSLTALGASAPVTIFAFGPTERMRISAGVNVGSDGVNPGAENFRVAGTTNTIGDRLVNGVVSEQATKPTTTCGTTSGNGVTFTWVSNTSSACTVTYAAPFAVGSVPLGFDIAGGLGGGTASQIVSYTSITRADFAFTPVSGHTYVFQVRGF